MRGGRRGAPGSWRGAAAGGSAGVRAAGRQQGAGEPGGAAGRRGAAREPEGGCCRGSGLRDGNGAQAAHGAGSITLAPAPLCRGAGDTHPPAVTPPSLRGRGDRLPALPSTLWGPAPCRWLPPWLCPGGPSPPPGPFTAASVVPGAGAGGAEVQRGRGAGAGAETLAVTVTVTAEGLRRAGGGGPEVLWGEQRAGCHGASVGMLWDQATPEGTCEVSPYRNSSPGRAVPGELRAVGQWERGLQRVPGACWSAGEVSPSPPAISYLCGASGCHSGGKESSHGHPVGQHPVAPGACVGRGGEGSTPARVRAGPRPSFWGELNPGIPVLSAKF